MNILLTSVGRRAYMVKYFQEIIKPYGEVHVCNSDENTVAFKYADKAVVSPLIYNSQYIPFLLDYCQSNRIDILISLFDIDLPILAKNKDQFQNVGTSVIVSDERIVKICNDKWKTYNFFRNNGFHTPKTYLSLNDTINALESGELNYPLIIKPRFGCGSLAVTIAENYEELVYSFRRNKDRINKTYLKYESSTEKDNIIVQEFLAGEEYGADIINDLQGNVRNIILRKKIAMRSGETDIAEIVNMPSVESVLKSLGLLTHHIANMDCDIIMVNDIPYLLEMNARFGGGYPFSHSAGCNLPKAIVEWVQGNDVDNDLLKVNVGFKGYKEIIIS